MHKEFIEKAKKLEQDFINGEVKLNDQLDWLKLKNYLWSLGDLWAEEENKLTQEELASITLDNCKSFARNLFHTMKKMEQKHDKKFNEVLKTMDYQLRFIVEYNSLSNYRKELAEQYTLEKEQNPTISFIDKTDIFGNSYRIKESDKAHFENSCTKQREMYEEYRQIHTCVYKEKKEQIQLLEEYNQDAEKCMYGIIENEIKIVTLDQWRIFKESVYSFQKNFNALSTNIIEIEHLQLGKNLYKDFIDLLANCIHTIEEKYDGKISKEDLPFIMKNIWILCKYQSLTLEKVNIHSIKASLEDKQMEKVEVSTENKSLKFTPSQAEIYSRINKEQNELKEKYDEAIQFIFGELKEEQTSKRGL